MGGFILAMPPIDALYAIDSMRVFPKIKFSSSGVAFKSFICLIIAIPMGSIITAVAVLEIHMERKAVANIKPKIIFLTSVPIILITEAIPIAATSLLPIILFPLTGALS